ncbi:cellulose biosynthesis protein BcsG [Halomonas sp. HP20-15]|uniref:cellulose biosynthesis protein BcsG n=1 Tax=Halomonas sp. HP20-15 TaxID=3085901 RepID=UPI002981394D|nr:cellulose biosynthesis protein BcsG [Halomonas sp. HP20-15]MDW5377123.1 cellulose biosynthesis protein BcsG [Halomonas sp. HP20-15]
MNRIETSRLESPGRVGTWRGLGLWNLYFIVKLALYWRGAIDFDALANLVFAAFLLVPLPPLWLHRLRHVAAIPVGVVLFYHDAWLPPFERLLAQSSQVGAMSPVYLLDLAGRIVNWEWLGVLFVLAVGYGFIAPWIRVSVPVVLGLVWLAVAPLLPVAGPVPQESALAALPSAPSRGLADVVQADEPAPAPTEEASDAVLDRRLEAFYAAERQRRTQFAARPAGAAPFDLLVINICSLSWDDMAVAGLTDHPLFDYLDAVFDNFNSATSYSGPAGIRLLQASCGQRPHGALYGDVPRECHLFENLAELGFAQNLVLNHDGQFDGYLKELQQEGGLDVPKLPMNGLAPVMTAFDDSPVYADGATLERWAAQDTAGAPSATFYNTVSLHDGNRYVGQRGFADYRQRLVTLFDDLLTFLQRLDQEGRRVAVLIVPEHGAARRGDKMQFPGMREIPNPTMTHVPVGLKLTGMAQPRQGEPLRVSEPTSYLAVSELVSRLVASDMFGAERVDWPGLLSGLPSTAPVSENEAVVVMPYQGVPYVRLKGDGWMPYPQ